VGPTLYTPSNTTCEPDYAVFATSKDYQDAIPFKKQVDNKFFDFAIGVGDAKAWNVDLDKKAGRRSPSQQILEYIIYSSKHYGFITNGRTWRLYRGVTADSLFRPDVYFQIDLLLIITANTQELKKWHNLRQSLDEFDMNSERVFWLTYFFQFFSPGAYFGDGPTAYRGKKLLERFYESSISRRTEIQDDLKDRVFDSLQITVRGFYNCPHWSRVGNSPPTDEDLNKLYQSGLLFLYRILFILNAEARGLLDSISYQSISLSTLAQDLNSKLTGPIQLSLTPTLDYNYWPGLRKIFSAISDERISKQVGVTHYNGGLFDSTLEGHQDLELLELDDQSLYLLFNKLLFAEVTMGEDTYSRLINYGALEVRHLGYIYEGLLEYKLRFTEQDLYLVDGKYVKKAPSSQVIEETIFKNQLFLATSKLERKATGTYYTPEHVVNYIVSSSLDKICSQLGSWENVLDINVLDPAMGSGHFLVAAIDYLAGYIHSHKEAELPIELKIDEKSDELMLWKRVVAERCIYGVDKNPLAVELAKLSIWLATANKGKALSFLDAHLRCGNSLLGSTVDQLDAPPLELRRGKWVRIGVKAQSLLIDAVSSTMKKISYEAERLETMSATNAAQVSQMRQEYQKKVSKPVESLRVLADIWMHQWFGNKENKVAIAKRYDTILRAGSSGELSSNLTERDPRRYFHWDLEFPHVVAFGKETGFDIIIGNPPYEVLASKEIGYSVDDEINFFKMSGFYELAISRKLNLFSLFIAKGLQLLKDGGVLSMIVPLSLLGGTQSTELRKWLLAGKTSSPNRITNTQARFTVIHTFPQHVDRSRRIFPDAEQATCIFSATNQNKHPKSLEVYTHPGRVFEKEDAVESRQTMVDSFYRVSYEDIEELDNVEYVIPFGANQKEISLAVKMARNPNLIELGKISKIAQGEFNITTSKKRKVVSLVPAKEFPMVLRGAHVARYRLQNAKQGTELYVIPKAIQSYLSPAKMKDTNKTRIVIQEVTRADRDYRRIIANLVDPPSYCGHTLNYVTDTKAYDPYAILVVINSAITAWRFKLTSTSNHVSGRELGQVLVPKMNTATSYKSRTSYFEDLLQKNRLQEFESELLTSMKKSNGPNKSLIDGLAAIGRVLSGIGQASNNLTNAFFDWLDNLLQTSIAEWSGTRAFRILNRVSFKKFYTICQKNTKQIGITNWDNPGIHSKLKREYEKFHATLSSKVVQSNILEDIADNILFEVFGLSSTERKIVLSKCGSRHPAA